MTASTDFNHDGSKQSLAPDTILQERYRIVRQLGRGGMGAVYEAIDQRLGITVALKETLSSELSMRRQFEHEARLLAGMQHPALPRVSDHFVEGNRAFLVMEYIGGVDLAKIISQQPGPFPREQVIAWADQLLDALIYLHSRDRQVIHRDIKPHNLKLSSTGQIALLDFGLAKAQPADSSVTASQAFFGYTRHYAPLEQIQDQRTDQRSDIYALGATLYHLLTGIKPPDALVRASALVSGRPDPLKPANKIHGAVGSEIAAILQTAMAQRPEDRYASANEFREAFRRMGRTRDLASIIDSEIDAGIAPRTTKVIDQSAVSADTRTVVKGAVVQMVMVESARRFGPGGMTVVLLALVSLAGGVLYASPDWFQSSAQTSMGSSTTMFPTQPAANTARRPDRVSDLEKTRDGKSKTQARTRPSRVESSKEFTMAKREVVLGNARLPLRPQSAPAQLRQAVGRSRVKAPSIRLPNPEFGNPAPARSAETPRAYRVSSHAAPAADPKFYRARDGTLSVKFSDGTTRIIRR